MTAIVFPIGSNSRSIEPVEIMETVEVGIYRKDETEGNVKLQTEDEVIDLGHHDISVSRMRPDGAPIRFSKKGEDIYLRNVDNESYVEIEYLRTEEELEKGEITKIREDCRVRPGHNTELMVVLESSMSEDTSKGHVDIGIIRSTCDLVDQAVRNSDHRTIMYANTLLTLVQEHPVSNKRYDEYKNELETEIKNLDETEDLGDGDQLGEERIKSIERITNGIMDVYTLHRDS